MAEIFLEPNNFQAQIDSYNSKTEIVAKLKYTLEENSISLQSLDKYMECIKAMNELIVLFSEFALLDGETMKRIKAKWMNTDGEIATKTVGEILEDRIHGKK